MATHEKRKFQAALSPVDGSKRPRRSQSHEREVSKLSQSPPRVALWPRSNTSRGVEWVQLEQNNLRTASLINDVILETVQRLAREGKRLLWAPRLLHDGICFDWVLDDAVKNEGLYTLLKVEGISPDVLHAVFRQRTGGSRSDTVQLSKRNNSTVVSRQHPQRTGDINKYNTIYGTGTASDPTILGSDDVQSLGPDPSISCGRNLDGNPSTGSSQVAIQVHQGPDMSYHGFKETIIGPSYGGSLQDPRSVATYPAEPYPDQELHDRMPSRHTEAVDGLRNIRCVDNRAHSCSSMPSTSHAIYLERASVEEEANERIRSPAAIPNALTNVSVLDGVLDLYTSSAKVSDGANIAVEKAAGARDGSNVEKVPPHRAEQESLSIETTSGEARPLHSAGADENADFPRHREVTLTVRSGREPDPLWGNFDALASSSEDETEHQYSRADTQRAERVVPIPELYEPAVALLADLRSSLMNGIGDHDDRAHLQRYLRSSSGSEASQPRHEENTSTLTAVRRTSAKKRNDRPTPQSRSAPEPASQHTAHADVSCAHAGRTYGITIPKTTYSRARRLLISSDANLPHSTIAMRGDIHFIESKKLHRISRYALHSTNTSRTPDRHVEDACLVEENLIAIGYNLGPAQVSLIPLSADQSPRRFDLAHKAHSTVIENRALASTHLNPGVSCLVPSGVSGLQFLTGGHDKHVYWWTIEHEGRGYAARSQRIDVFHSRSVHAVAYRASDECVFSSAGAHIHSTHLAAMRPSEPVRVSASVTQVHVHPQAPHLILLEVDHMDRQIHLYDTRKSGFNRSPCLEFGYREVGENAEKPGRRYVKGSASFNCFGRGYGDGMVRVWDYRNSNNVMVKFEGKRSAPIIHTVLSGLHVIGYGGHIVTYWDLSRGN